MKQKGKKTSEKKSAIRGPGVIGMVFGGKYTENRMKRKDKVEETARRGGRGATPGWVVWIERII